MKQIRFDNGGKKVRKTSPSGSTSKPSSVQKTGKKPVDVKLPALSDDMLRTIKTLLADPNTKENVKGILKNMGWREDQISAFIQQQSTLKKQGASSKPTPPNARELGLPQAIVDESKPAAQKSGGSITHNGKIYYSNSDILTDDKLDDKQRFNLLKKMNNWSDKDAKVYYQRLLKSGFGHQSVDIHLGFIVGGGTAEDADKAMQSVAHKDAQALMLKYLQGGDISSD